jgi:heat shock protein HslJ
MTQTLALALGALAALAVTPTPGRAGEPAKPAIAGTITAGDAAAPLPADAQIRVWLESAPSFHQAARRVAETTFPAPGRRFPIPFTLSYPAAEIAPGGHYQLRALVSSGKRVLFFTRLAQAAAPGGPPQKVEIPVEPFGGKKLQVTAISADMGLSGEWSLTALPDERAPIDAQAPPTLAIDGPARQISGSTGCNQFFGTCTIGKASALSLSPSGTTMKACPEDVMGLETAYLAALRKVNAYRIHGATLELLAGDHVLARFERRRNKTPSE